MKQILLILICLGLVGCAEVEVINNALNYIYYKDGINKKEALYLAQKYCVEESRCRRNCMVCSVGVSDNELKLPGVWRVFFKPKIISNFFVQYCRLYLDKQTGELLEFKLVE